MRNMLCIQLFFALVVFLLCGCDKPESTVSQVDQPTPSVAAEPSQKISAEEEHLQIILLPNDPTAKTALYARVSGAREPVRFNWLKNGQIIDGEEQSSLGVEYLTKGDTIEVEASAGTLQASAEAKILNSPPSIPTVKFSYGSVVTVFPQGEDRDGDVIGYRYQWLVNDYEVLFETSNALPGEFFSRGDRVSVAITPFDEETDGTTVRVKDVLIENKPPVITSTPPPAFDGKDFAYTITAEDPEGEALTFYLESAPEGMTIDSQTGEIGWSIGAEATGAHQVKIKAEDESGRWTIQEFSLDILYQSGE